MTGVNFTGAIGNLAESAAIIPELDEAIKCYDLQKSAACYNQIAEVETKAYLELSNIATGKITSTTNLMNIK